MDTIEFAPKGDDRGWLIALESLREVPFEIRRVYYIYGTQPDFHRGKHAHRNLQQLAICVAGSCRFLLDDGRVRREYHLNRNTLGLLVGSMIWREMYEFTPDCVLLVLADRVYDPQDYIHDYDEFLRVAKGGSASAKLSPSEK
jgi:dTDP-4-dehydrorhamnose 3,5-epimerase-like enzyme